MPDDTPQYDVFISYARADGFEIAARLDEALQAENFTTWRDIRGIDPAKDFTAEIEVAIKASTFVVVCITPDTARSESFVRREIQYALLCEKPVIVARFDQDTLPPIPIINNTWVEFHKGWTPAFGQLCGYLRGDPDAVARSALPNDPFRPYLQAVYEQIVRFLDQAVIRLIDLTSEATADAVNASSTPAPVPARRGMMDQFFTAHGLSSEPEAAVPTEKKEETTFTKFTDAFEHYGGRVLLLGAPGAGKTVTLFSHAREAITRRLDDPNAPLPLLGLIATWDARAQTPLADWLAAGYDNLPREGLARTIDAGKALLLLDGLDELGREQIITEKDAKTGAEKIVEQFDPRRRFLNTIPTNNRIIVSCRVQDYTEIGQKIALNGAVTLQPLSEIQMHTYLAEQPDLLAAIEADDDLEEMLSTPLIMSLFAFAYRDLTPEDAAHLRNLAASPGDLRGAIFERYVHKRYAWEERRLQRQGQEMPFSLDEIYRVLGDVSIWNIRNWYEKENVLPSHGFSLDANPLPTFTALAVQLNLLAPGHSGGWRFVHLLLRDYFAFKPLVAALSNENGWTRHRAAFFLGQLNDTRAVSPLITALHDIDEKVRHSTTDALGQLGDARAVKPLIDSLLDDSVPVRLRAVNALKLLGDIRAISSLIDALSDNSALVRSDAASALGQLGDARAIEPLCATLRDEYWVVRRNAARALERIGTPEALAAVEAYERGEIGPDPE